jgi:hypothetical protein
LSLCSFSIWLLLLLLLSLTADEELISCLCSCH